MSTILKALRRIEEEKADGLERPLREDVVLAPTGRRRVNPSALIAVAAVAFAATVALLTWVHDREVARARAAATAAAASSVTRAISVAAAPPAEKPAPRTVPVEAAPPAEKPAPPAAPAGAEAVPTPPPPAAPATPSAATASPEVVLLHPDARGQSPITVVSESPPAAAPPIAVRPAPKRAAPPAPAASSLRVLRTSWHPRPEKRVAWVQAPGAAAPQAVHEGDRVEGWLVREIEPAAVVLSDGAGEIRRSVGSP